jgi:hypothetical protein
MHCNVLLARGNLFLPKVDTVKTCSVRSSTAAIIYFSSFHLSIYRSYEEQVLVYDDVIQYCRVAVLLGPLQLLWFSVMGLLEFVSYIISLCH